MNTEAKPSVVPVILAGGSGTRLWPLSRKSYPKQFSRLLEKESLFQSCANRLRRNGPIAFAPPLVFTSADYRFIVQEQLEEIGVSPEAIYIEPESRNTAPAVLAAAYHICRETPDALMLVAPSDHLIPDSDLFAGAVAHGVDAANDGHLVTFGVAPTRPETGYGYLEVAEPDASGAIRASSFVEKPTIEEAEAMIAAGKYLWNAGIFLFKAREILRAFERCTPVLCESVNAAFAGARPDLGFIRLAEKPWDAVESVSLDYAVLERAENLKVVPLSGKWSDLGGWDAVWREIDRDENGVATSDHAHAIDCRNTLLRSENAAQEIIGIGLSNILAVAMPDAVLVADMSRAQDVKRAVDVLQKAAARQAEVFPKEHRPWGSFESLIIGSRFQVKRIQVQPGKSLSLQSHFLRSEHWIVVEGTAKVTIDGKSELVSENQSVYVPLGSKHRLENPGLVPMVLIEVQTGPYLGEDDILRYEDTFARA